MTEIRSIRRIESPYEGSLEERIHDLFARITESCPPDAESLLLNATWYLQEFAVQHVKEIDNLRDAAASMWQRTDFHRVLQESSAALTDPGRDFEECPDEIASPTHAAQIDAVTTPMFLGNYKADRQSTFRLALKKAKEMAREIKADQIGLAVHHPDCLRGSAVQDELSEFAFTSLMRGSASVGDQQLLLMWEQDKSEAYVRGPLIAAYLSPVLLEEFVRDPRATHIVYLPWSQRGEEACFLSSSPIKLDGCAIREET